MLAIRRTAVTALVSMGMAVFAGCSTPAPKSFSVSMAPNWSTLEIRDGLTYQRAWDTTLEILVKTFEIDSAIREEGYIRTGWSYTWTGQYQSGYRVRVTVKFSPDRSKLQFLTEAQFLEDEDWRVGTDSRLVSTLKTDLMGTVGRTAR